MKKGSALLCFALAFVGCNKREQPTSGRVDGELTRQALEWTIEGLLSKSGDARQKAFDLCAKHWSQARGHVGKLIGSPQLTKRLAAAYLLSRLASRDELPLLRRCLADQDERVALIALPGIGRLQDRDSVPVLLKLASEMKYTERGRVLPVLARLDPDATRTHCLELTRQESWAHRRSGTQTLAFLEDDETRDRLAQLLDDPVWMVRCDAARALGIRRVASARTKLLAMTTDGLPAVRAAAVDGLSQIAGTDDLATIGRLAGEDPDKYVRVAAVRGLGHYPEAAARPLVERVLGKKGEHRKVRYAAVLALRQFGSPSALDLAQRTVAADEDLRRTAAMNGESSPVESADPQSAQPRTARPGK